MNIQVETVTPANFNKTLCILALSKQKETPAPIGANASAFNESLIVFCNVPEKSLIRSSLNCVSLRFHLTIKPYLLRQIQSGLSKGLCSNLNPNMQLFMLCTKNNISYSKSLLLFLTALFSSSLQFMKHKFFLSLKSNIEKHYYCTYHKKDCRQE